MGNSLEFQREEVSSIPGGFLIYDSYSSRFVIHVICHRAVSTSQTCGQNS
jgi:hypothetical protein